MPGMHDGAMKSVRWLPSPHFNDRPEGTEIDLIVLHAISLPAGEFGSRHIEALFAGTLDVSLHPSFSDLADMRVSAHFLIDRQGCVTQFVACRKRAWHAGASCWQGRENCNDYAIGIEIIGDEEQPFTRIQYRQCARLCSTLMRRFPAISGERIVGHQHVAPGRKWDPGRQWDWRRFRRSLTHIKYPLREIR